MAQSKHHTLWPVHETCRWPVKCRRHVIKNMALACGFSAKKKLTLFPDWADTHTENMKKHRSLSPLIRSEDVLRKLIDSWGREGQSDLILWKVPRIRAIFEIIIYTHLCLFRVTDDFESIFLQTLHIISRDVLLICRYIIWLCANKNVIFKTKLSRWSSTTRRKPSDAHF